MKKWLGTGKYGGKDKIRSNDERKFRRRAKKQTPPFRLEPLTYFVLRKCLALTALIAVLVLLHLLRLGGKDVSQKDIPTFYEMLEHVFAAALLCPSLALLLDLVLKRSDSAE